jgi:hypothetical protein
LHRHATQFGWFAVLVVVATFAGGTECIAQSPSGAVIRSRLPVRQNSVSPSTGLFVEVSDDGLGNGQYGYRRFLVDVQSPTPVAADTQITVRLRALQWQYGSQSMTVEADGVLKAGETKATVTLRTPQYVEWSVLTWDIWIDGARDRYLSRGEEDWQQLNDNGTSRWRMGSMAELQIVPGHGELFTILPTQQGSALGENGLTALGEWRDNWLDYTPFDIVSTDLPTLLMTETQTPEKLLALRQWVKAGGVLWVRSIGDDWERLRHLDPILSWETTEDTIEPHEPTADQPAWAEGWSYVNLRRRGRSETDPDDPNNPNGQAYVPLPPGMPPQAQFDNTPRYSTDWFVVRRCGWGLVAAYRGDVSDVGPSTTRRDLFGAARYWRSHDWTRRHGLTPGQANEDFSKWLIPGVGLAPVVSFQVLITLFVIAIGPANYWLLKRAGRLHLMVLTVPLAALAITGVLLAYGLFSDGFSTRLRAQTITRLDQKTREAATWSRLSYYAAFAPRDGLTFSDHTAIYPIEANTPGSYRGGGSHHYEIEWNDGQQHLAKGWLASRTPTQYLAIEPRKTDAGLKLKLKDPAPTVTNNFATEAQLIIVIDGDGKFLLANDVATEGPQALERVERSAAVSALRAVLMDREPRNPEGYDTIADSSLMSGRSYGQRPYGPQGGGPTFGTMRGSLLDDEWQALLGVSGGEALTLPPRSYVVVSELALLPQSGEEIAVEDSSVHIVIGSW